MCMYAAHVFPSACKSWLDQTAFHDWQRNDMWNVTLQVLEKTKRWAQSLHLHHSEIMLKSRTCSHLKFEHNVSCRNVAIKSFQQGLMILLPWWTKPHTLSNCKVNLSTLWLSCNYSLGLTAFAALSHTRIYLLPTPTVPSPLQRRRNFI